MHMDIMCYFKCNRHNLKKTKVKKVYFEHLLIHVQVYPVENWIL